MTPILVVTGATKGIGRAIALRFAEEGYHIAFNARNANAVTALEEYLAALYPDQRFLGCVCDMSERAATEDFGKEVLKELGTPDVLVNNAGVFLPGNILDETEAGLEKTLQTNLYSAYYLSRILLPPMRDAARGFVFNMCSVASIQAYPNGAIYSMSKFALYAFSKSLRQELLDSGIKVTSVLPGATFTASWEGADIPESRFMPASDIANSIWEITRLSDSTVVEELILRPQLGDL